MEIFSFIFSAVKTGAFWCNSGQLSELRFHFLFDDLFISSRWTDRGWALWHFSYFWDSSLSLPSDTRTYQDTFHLFLHSGSVLSRDFSSSYTPSHCSGSICFNICWS